MLKHSWIGREMIRQRKSRRPHPGEGNHRMRLLIWISATAFAGEIALQAAPTAVGPVGPRHPARAEQVESVTIALPTDSLIAGDTMTVTATVWDTTGNPVVNPLVRWSVSGDEDAIDISDPGID